MKKQIIKGLFLSLSLLFGAALLPCRSENATNTTSTKSSALTVVSVKELFKSPTNFVGSTIILEGFVTDVCKRRGCWAILHDSDPDNKDEIRVKQDESKPFNPFLPDLQGKTVCVTGTVHLTKIDTDYLDKWEARVKAAKLKATEGKEQKNATTNAYDAVFKQIDGLRKRLAGSQKGYLNSISFAVEKWQPKTEQP